MADYMLDLRMGVDDKLTNKSISNLDAGALSYSVDKQNLYIDALKEDKITTERQMINSNKAYAIRDKEEDIVAESSVGKYSFKENEKTIALGNSSHAEGLGRKAQAYITGSANSVSYTYQFIDGGDFNQSDGHTNRADMDQINTPLVWVYEDEDGNVSFATGYSMSHSSSGTINLSNTLSVNKALNNVIVDVYSGGYALGNNSHVEGMYSKTLSENSHAEGVHTRTTGVGAHAEGYRTTAEGKYSHVEGSMSHADGDYSHAEGLYARATGYVSHSEGYAYSRLIGDNSWFYGGAHGDYSHNEGFQTLADGDYSHAQGFYTYATGRGAHAEGTRTEASGNESHSEGYETIANNYGSHAEGRVVISSGQASHAEGFVTAALGDYSHAEGYNDLNIFLLSGEANATIYTITYGSIYQLSVNDIVYSYLTKIVDGNTQSMASKTKAVIAKILSIDYDNGTITLDKTLSTNNNVFENVQVYIYSYYASGIASHVEGTSTIATGDYSHAEGDSTLAQGVASHAEGISTKALGDYSHTSGLGTIAIGTAQTVVGKYNIEDENSLFIVGNSENYKSRSNAISITSSGDTYISGDLYINVENGNPNNITDANVNKHKVANQSDLDNLKEEVQEVIDNLVTDVWIRGSTPPSNTKLFWIRYDGTDTYGNGVLYYYTGGTATTDYQGWTPMSAIYS